jgi:protein phosphatase
MLDELLVAAPLAVLAAAALLLRREARQRKQAHDFVAQRGRGEVDAADQGPVVNVLGVNRYRLPSVNALADDVSFEWDESHSTAITLYETGAETDEPTSSTALIHVRACGLTDPGRSRARNEDAILLLPEQHVFVVADGMGGHAAGHIASKLVVDTIETAFREHTGREAAEPLGRPRRAQELARTIEEANRKIRETARRTPEYEEMGATVIGARFSERKQRAYIGHVGDSRCYRLRDGRLQLLTNDHTLAGYGVVGPMGGRIRRSLGASERVSVDVRVDKPLVGDIYVLCSDGLNKMLDEASICRIVSESSNDLERAMRQLVEAANSAGGRDNVSVILVGVYPPQTVA